MPPLHFSDALFEAQLLRALGYVHEGGAEVGECLATAAHIVDGDVNSWRDGWRATAERVDAAAAVALAAGHRV